MGSIKLMTMLVAGLFIVSCGAPDPPPPKKTFLEPMLQTKQRARDVQNTVDASADATRKAIDTQERGDTSP